MDDKLSECLTTIAETQDQLQEIAGQENGTTSNQRGAAVQMTGVLGVVRMAVGVTKDEIAKHGLEKFVESVEVETAVKMERKSDA